MVDDALARSRALVEAARLISAEGHDLDAVLDALGDQARALLGSDAASLQLATADGRLVVRRPNPLAPPGTEIAAAGAVFSPGPVTRRAIDSRRAAVIADFRGDVPAAQRMGLDAVGATVIVPLHAGDGLQGVLYLDWRAPRSFAPEEIELAEALGAHAAVAIRTALLVEAERGVRAELEAVFDAATDAIMVWGADGRLQRANQQARALFTRYAGEVTLDAATFLSRVDVRHSDGTRLDRPVFEPALRGETYAEELVSPAGDGTLRRVHVACSPVRGRGGVVAGAVVVARDLTAFHDVVAERGRLDGAIKTARALAHEITQHLSVLTAYGSLLPGLSPGEAVEAAAEMAQAAHDLGDTAARLLQIVRFEEVETPIGPALDLDASVGPGTGPPAG